MDASTKVVSFEMNSMSSRDQYILLRDTVMPRPIAWVSTIDAENGFNLAPYSFFNVICAKPPLLGFSVGPAYEDFEAATPGAKDTLANLRIVPELVINLVPEFLLEPMALSSDPLPYGENEFDHAGLLPVASTHVKPPRVEGAPVAFECRLHQLLHLGSHHLVLAEVIFVHVHEELYVGAANGVHRVNLLKNEQTRLLSRLDRANYGLLRQTVLRLRKDAPGQS